MSSFSKTKQRSITNEANKSKKTSKFVNGRWTEKEHYLFLVAVKEHGRDWKKIEEIVKTRSSTQARSHSQKVLKDDLMDKIDEEIERLGKIYDKSTIENTTSHNISKSTRNPQLAQGVVKNKRKAKRTCKEIAEKKENEKRLEAEPKPVHKSEDEFAYPNEVDESEEYSDYSYPDNPNMKLFSIQRVHKRVTKRKRR